MSGSEKAKQKKEVQKKLRTKATFVIIVVATLVLLAAASSLAWFTWGSIATAGTIDIKVQKADSMYIRTVNDGNWYSSLDVDYFPLQQICGDGEHFFKPIFSSSMVSSSGLEGVTGYTNKFSGFEDLSVGAETVASHALVKEFEIKSDTPSDYVYISSSSYLIPDLEKSAGSCLNSSGLSSAHIAGAMRVSLSVYSSAISDYELKMVWIPNPKCELYTYGTKDNYLVHYNVTSDGIEYTGTPESSYTFTTSVSDQFYVTYNEATGYYKDPSTGVIYVWDLDKLRSAPNAAGALLSDVEVGEIFKLKMVVWVEGTDRECENALLGGKTSLLILFEQGE